MKPHITLEDKDAYRKRLFGVVKHIENVNEAAKILAERMIDHAETQEELDTARRLIQRARRHDLSKFEGIEWTSLHPAGEEMLPIAIDQHQQTNDHHPEYFVGGVAQMNDLQIAEMVCDWKARSTEFGSDLRVWIKEDASKKYGFSVKSGIYKKIKKFVELLLEDKF